MIDEIMYTDYRLPEMIPIITAIPDGATSYSYRVLDKAGLGRFIDLHGDTAPSANVGLRNVPYLLGYAGIQAKWSIEDLRRAMFLGVPLDTSTIDAATNGAMDHIEIVGLEGDDEMGFKGLTNLATTGVSAVSRTDSSATLEDMTGDEMHQFLDKQIVGMIESTQEVFGRRIKAGLSVYLPIAQAAEVNRKRLVDRDQTAWQYFQQHNAWKKYTGMDVDLKWLAELDGAGSSNTDRMILGINDVRIMEMAIPIMPRALTTINKGYTYCVPFEYKMSGLNLKRPAGIRYIDAV